jgi:LPXTG-motif cell wall-anchored protein
MAMPPPPQGWASWSKSSDAHNGSQTFYQLTLAAATKDGNPVASFHAFCNADCSDCEVRKTSDNTLPMNATCEIETPLPTPLEYNTCNTADFDRGSFFLRLPVVIDSQGSELCVLEESPAAVEGGISFIEYPANTDCDANGTNPGFRSGAMMVTAVAPITNDVCTANSDGTYYQLKEESGKPGPQENMTIVSGKINCANQPPKTSPADYCLEIYCDKVEGVVLNGMGSGGCLTIDNGDKASLSMRIQGSGSVQKCYMPPAPPKPKPKPSTGGKSNTPLIAGAAGGGAVLLIIIVIVVRKRRASRAAAYSVLQGSSYTES